MEQDCVSDIVELLLEHPQLFTLSEAAVLTTINTQLKVSRVGCNPATICTITLPV